MRFSAHIYTASNVTASVHIRYFHTANVTTMGIVKIIILITKGTVYTSVVTL